MAKQRNRERSENVQGDSALAFRDRIVEFRRVKASELKRNVRNWRRHPESQKGALTAMLQRIGFVGAVVVRKVPDGLEILDGHLRSDIQGDHEIPVLVTDLNDQEAADILLTYDPISAMAETNDAALSELLKDADLDDNAELRRLMADIGSKLEQEEKNERKSEKFEVEGMSLQAHEHYDYIVVLASTTHDFNVLCDRLDMKPTKRRHGMGTARAIRAERLLKILGKPAKV